MTISSKDNDKLKLVRKLAERKHREREGLFVTEGEDLLEAGLAAGYEPALVLSRAGTGIQGEAVEAALLDAVSTLGSGTRVIAIWSFPSRPEEAKRPGMRAMTRTDGRLPGAGAVGLYLHGVGDPGNVGSIVRSAAALGASSVVLGPGCADAYGPKAIRASMGTIFALYVTPGEIETTPAPRLALVAHDGDSEPATDAATLCLGAEREGLPSEITDACDARWTIPTHAGVESLGVAAAAAIALSRIGSPTEERA
jgi:TrmH family RNA methyltransferase